MRLLVVEECPILTELEIVKGADSNDLNPF